MMPVTILRHIAAKLGSSPEAASHDYRNAFVKARRWVNSVAEFDLSESRVLVIGCGYNYPDPLLWSSESKCTVGIDVRESFWRSGLVPLIAEFRKQGSDIAEAFARAMILRASYRGYYCRLREISGTSFDEMTQDLISYDGKCLPFASESFDVVISNAVLEHVSNLDSLLAQVARVTKVEGVCYHLWHNYYSLHGAHIPEDMALRNPWGHLRDDADVRRWLTMSGTYLNKLSPDEIVRILSRDFQAVAVHRLDRNHNVNGFDNDYKPEGEDLLSPELSATIPAYPRELVLTRAYAFLGRKSASSK